MPRRERHKRSPAAAASPPARQGIKPAQSRSPAPVKHQENSFGVPSVSPRTQTTPERSETKNPAKRSSFIRTSVSQVPSVSQLAPSLLSLALSRPPLFPAPLARSLARSTPLPIRHSVRFRSCSGCRACKGADTIVDSSWSKASE